MSPVLDEGLRLADLGVPVHWLWGPLQGPKEVQLTKPGKCVARKDWQDRAFCCRAVLRREYRAGRNLGLHMGWVEGARICFVALDFDSDDGFRFAAQRGIPLSPLRTLTRSGQHWLYRHPGPAFRCATRVKVDPARCVDVRGERGNLVLPPSVHHTGFVYQPVEPWTKRLIENAPVWDPAWVPELEAAAVTRLDRKFLQHDAQRTERARRALAKMRPGVQGDNGSRATFIAAKMLFRQFGLSESTALDLLRTDFNPRCVPPWSERELRHKVESAARSFRDAP